MTNIKIVILVVLAIVGAVVVLGHSSAQDEQLFKLSNCIVETAKKEGYSGNPYSKQAWEIFAGDCIY